MPPAPKVAFACPIPWEEMTGSGFSRRCDTCGHMIHNLSVLGSAARAALLRRAQTEKICGTYFVRLSGELVTPEAPLSRQEARSLRQVGLAALSAGALALAAGCVSPPPETKTPPPPHKAGPIPAQAKPEDGEVIQLVGFIVNVPDAAAGKTPSSGK